MEVREIVIDGGTTRTWKAEAGCRDHAGTFVVRGAAHVIQKWNTLRKT